MVGLIVAMKIEAEEIIKKLTDKASQKISGIEFTRGKLYGTDVVVCVCGIGKVFAGACAEIMVLRYSPDYIINTGVGGTLTDKLGIGDVAIAVSAVQHDMDTTPLGDPRGYIDVIKEVYLKCDERVVSLVEKACAAEKISCVKGTIATGDQFIHSEEKKDEIKSHFEDCVCCDMEGAAVGQICLVNKVPFAVIRAISDNAGGESPADYNAFARTAANNSIKVLEKVLGQLD
ncbi:MAG: 5'-methylthioadenosine/adenosylhomocysteine nucleosidase [Clostridia bacterium]|nr:5'-methylthioadenosine/adenosylhomocysteine nucleosidase [Clostridia bacterium]